MVKRLGRRLSDANENTSSADVFRYGLLLKLLNFVYMDEICVFNGTYSHRYANAKSLLGSTLLVLRRLYTDIPHEFKVFNILHYLNSKIHDSFIMWW